MPYTEPLHPGKVYHIFNHAVATDVLFKSERNYQYFLQQWTKYAEPVVDTFAWALLPNHFHAILIIGGNPYNTDNTDAKILPNHTFAPQSKNLASVMRGYKSAVTTFARKNNIKFDWQARYHDHIIRSMDEYHRISKYIINNPGMWKQDKFFTG